MEAPIRVVVEAAVDLMVLWVVFAILYRRVTRDDAPSKDGGRRSGPNAAAPTSGHARAGLRNEDGKRGARRRQPPQARAEKSEGNCNHQPSWVSRIVPSLQGRCLPSDDSVPPNITSQSQRPQSMDTYFDDAVVVGLDCEMVGGGKGGWKSLLARCSVVTLDRIPSNESESARKKGAAPTNGTANNGQRQKTVSLDEDLRVLYDKYVIPKGRITDYRTEWSGITKDTYRQSNSPIPIVSFHQCQNEISQLFSSIGGRKVIVVGHALENDFEALEIEHPQTLVRDTAFYPPYMRKTRRKMFPRKLSTLASEEFGIDIQQKSDHPPALSDEPPALAKLGHDSVEDAAAALRLYWHKHELWERWLGYPLIATQQNSQSWPPLTMYLDGCNLPIGMRGVNFKELLANPTLQTTISSEEFRLTSRSRDGSNVSTVDWIPTFQSALLPGSAPKLESISVMFDGSKFGDIHSKGRKSAKPTGSLETRTFPLESATAKSTHSSIRIEVTENGDSADDVLVHRCSKSRGSGNSALSLSSSRKITLSLDRAIDILSSDSDVVDDNLSCYIVIRRKAGGSKTHRRLFDKLHLRRPNEGALCLSAVTSGLKKNSLRIARELQRQRGVEKVIELELRRRADLRHIVVTDDVLLTDRLVADGVLVLSFKQLTKMF
ncbi:hypothetical protein ACHAXT_000273 [Thalassiosira profunda]